MQVQFERKENEVLLCKALDRISNDITVRRFEFNFLLTTKTSIHMEGKIYGLVKYTLRASSTQIAEITMKQLKCINSP